MPQTYHRPTTLEDALELLSRQGVHTAVLAGGTRLNARLNLRELSPVPDELVDLQAIGLDEVSHGDNRLSLGAMVRIQTIVEDDGAPPLLRDMARREGPNTFRNAGTIGGAIVSANPESELLAALLIYDAEVTLRTTAGAHTMPLADFLADVRTHLHHAILTGVALETGGPTAHDRVARTPEDSPIVAAVARRQSNGSALLALCGVAATPILAGPGDIAALNPPADFRGSSAYRKEMARVLARRVLNELQNH